jgi:hypothetical protein
MLKLCCMSLAAMLASGAVDAQPAGNPRPATQNQRTGERPIDHGPFTPEASSAYQGGGVILQGAPGAPAPTPQPTPPGQLPSNMVVPR